MASLRYSTHVMQNSSTLNALIKFHLTIAVRLFFFFFFAALFSKEFYHTSCPLIYSSMKVQIPFCQDSGILTVVRFYQPCSISILLQPKQEAWNGSGYLRQWPVTFLSYAAWRASRKLRPFSKFWSWGCWRYGWQRPNSLVTTSILMWITTS